MGRGLSGLAHRVHGDERGPPLQPRGPVSRDARRHAVLWRGPAAHRPALGRRRQHLSAPRMRDRPELLRIQREQRLLRPHVVPPAIPARRRHQDEQEQGQLLHRPRSVCQGHRARRVATGTHQDALSQQRQLHDAGPRRQPADDRSLAPLRRRSAIRRSIGRVRFSSPPASPRGLRRLDARRSQYRRRDRRDEHVRRHNYLALGRRRPTH